MFPFLAPIKQLESRQNIEKYCENVNFVCFTDIPPSISTQAEPLKLSVESVATRSGSSLGSKSSSRPDSRQKSKSPLPSSRPQSSRSAKDSPIPPAPSEVVPPPSRHRNKGLETSSAMLELFGGGPSASSVFETIPPQKEPGNYRRTNAFEKDLEASSYKGRGGPFFTEVSDVNKTYERSTKRSKNGNQFDQSAQPGPEWFSEFEQMDMTGIELPPDPDCPAAKILEQKNTFVMQESSDQTTPESEGDWGESKKDIAQIRRNLPCEPGPDLEDDSSVQEELVEERNEVDTPNTSTVRKASVAAEGPETEETALVGDAEDLSVGGDLASVSGGYEMALLIRRAQIVNDDSVFSADVLIQDGVIAKIGVGIEVGPDVQIVEANEQMLLPAGIDVHTHLTAPDSADDLATGCKAALAGGNATVVELVTPKSGESLTAAIARVKKLLEKALCNVALSVVVKTWSEAVKKEMEKAVSEGVNSFVIDVEGDDKLLQCLEFCRSLGTHVRVLPENKNIVSFLEKKMLDLGINGPEGYLQSRPEDLESERVNSVCVLSQLTNCPISILSVSSVDTLSTIERARCSGSIAHAEIAAAAVASDGSHYFNKCLKHASGHLTDVPLRLDGQNRIVSALASQPLAVCTSGHRAIHSNVRLAAGDFVSMPKGAAGVEERMSVIWEKAVRAGRIDPMRFVAITSTNAAKMFNLYPKKGRIAVGADADLLLWDTKVKRKLGSSDSQSAADVNIYEGLTVHVQVTATIVGGHVAWKDGGVKDARGSFLALSPNSPYLFSVVQQRDKMSSYEKVEREPVSNGHKKSTGENPNVRGTQRKTHFESTIDFGSESRPSGRVRNPPGGRTTGIW